MRIPLLLDVLIVVDPLRMATLDNHPDVSRQLLDEGGWLNRVFHRQMYGTFTVGATALAVFTARGDEARAARQDRLERHLQRAAPDPAGIAELARYVAGAEPTQPIGMLAQQVIGQLFFRDYFATPASYRAARELGTLSGRLQGALAGRQARNRELLWSLAHDDPEVIHGTTIAVHTVVDSLERMRSLAARERGAAANPGTVVERCLVAPRFLFRSCTADTTIASIGRLRRGTLIVFRLNAMSRRRRDTDLAFARDAWNQCPAHDVVPRLLESVWCAAMAVSVEARRRRSSLSRAFTRGYAWLNERVPWYRLPKWVAVFNLLALRIELRQKNLYDTETAASRSRCPVTGWLAGSRHARAIDGSHNDLDRPAMGAAGTRFGRLVPLEHTRPDVAALLTPNPREVSNVLLARPEGEMLEATALNLLAAAWVQFEVHDWFKHPPPDESRPHELPLGPGDRWGDRTMRIGRATAEAPPDPDAPAPTHINTVTHWWDASQIYGSDPATLTRVRVPDDCTLAVNADGLLPYNAQTGIEITGVDDNWWVGLSLLHTLFTLEHNEICDRLRRAHPEWDNERLFSTARLINAALIAKIHTLEWTPAMLGHPALAIGMKANWWGLAGERIHRLAGRLHDSEAVSGIPGSPTDHHTAPYSMSEEFVAVYRMHPLIPDRFVFRSVVTGDTLMTRRLPEVAGEETRKILDAIPIADLFYSFGVAHPGRVALGNYPNELRDFTRIDGTRVDVAVADVLRDRERGVPRYNAFRRLFRLPPIASFKALNPQWAEKLRDVYGTKNGRDDVEALDLMVGMFAETPPPGFAFSDTAFRGFILMASRRLKSDRFFTTDYTEEVYTRTGLEWIENNDMTSVLTRHYPTLQPALAGVKNAFAPWRRIPGP